MRKLLFALLIIPFLTAAAPEDKYEKKYDPLNLPSGQVKVLSVSPIYIPDAKPGNTMIMLTYETKIPLANEIAVQKQIDEVWQAILPRVENGHYGTAVISANEPYNGLMATHKKSVDATYKKSADGKWQKN